MSVPRGVRTCELRVERQDNYAELLAPAGEDNPEAGPSEEENPHEGSRGLGQNGDPEEREVIVIEEPEPRVETPYKIVRVPRSPTQEEIE